VGPAARIIFWRNSIGNLDTTRFLLAADMDIIHWFQHDALELPRSRPTGDSASRLNEILDGYLSTTAILTGSDYITYIVLLTQAPLAYPV
jgi:hypothetical protein